LIIEIIVGEKFVAVAEQFEDVTVFECDELAKIKVLSKMKTVNLISYGDSQHFQFIQETVKNTKVT